ncbi:ATP-binding protein [Sphingosinicella sp. LHD-64]|uniref:sensor histidine kinase n=1 Tax=Sphingosinicella sp. LHD-64 TaxID=3072139 RepID=UPI00280F8CB4|nr:ATP-binding protein [Sphingosinicella sp. LHD-64]MDQ8754954.1 ATP-binding protein [Sphingosinicella sp. LHD-64]
MTRLPRPKLSARLAIAIILVVIASFALDQALRTLIPPPPFLVAQRAWLVDAVVRVARADWAESEGPAVGHFLEVQLQPEPAFSQGGSSDRFALSLQATLAAALGKPVADVRVRAETFSDNFWERSASTSMVVIPRPPILLSPQEAASDRWEPERFDRLRGLLSAEEVEAGRTSVLGRLDIAVRRDDGRWVVMNPRRTSDARWHYMRNLLAIAGNLLILAIFSIWMARSIIAPLSRLASAAERMGREREPTLITGMRQPEFAAIADTFNAMQLRLKRYVDERVQVLAAISHDLRTPLTRLRLLAEYVPDEEQRIQLKANVAEMEAMVADALAFMRGEVRSEAMEPVDLAALLISLADTRKDMGEDVAYEGPDHLDILCRPLAMRRALDNLIANGCRYGGSVRVALRVEGDGVVIDIVDRGPGIAPEDAERAFAPFERLDSSRSRETGGTGLGLAISRDVVRSHGGEIAFHRGTGGFTVRVILPGAIAIK